MDTRRDIKIATTTLKNGGLVAFPTETVYGLGGDARNADAVKKIFRVKGRPVDHPLIVHIAHRRMLDQWAEDISDLAWQLAERFWPGPLTLILRKKADVIDEVTGGADTVGLRVPRQSVALELLESFGDGVAAPSANRFGGVSPTCADDVRRDLGNQVDFVLDGGPCSIGIESTIVDVSDEHPAILRPGGITREQLEAFTGRDFPTRIGGRVKSPGQMPSHYAPQAYVDVVAADEVILRATKMLAAGLRVGLIAPRDIASLDAAVRRLLISENTDTMAHDLYAALRTADAAGLDVCLVVLPEERGIGAAVADRLRRAAGPRHKMPVVDGLPGHGT